MAGTKPQRNPQERKTVAISATIPVILNQTINGIAVRDNKTRSLVITELLEKGLGSK